MTQKNEASTKTISVIILSASYYEMFNLNGYLLYIGTHECYLFLCKYF